MFKKLLNFGLWFYQRLLISIWLQVDEVLQHWVTLDKLLAMFFSRINTLLNSITIVSVGIISLNCTTRSDLTNAWYLCGNWIYITHLVRSTIYQLKGAQGSWISLRSAKCKHLLIKHTTKCSCCHWRIVTQSILRNVSAAIDDLLLFMQGLTHRCRQGYIKTNSNDLEDP